MFKKKIEVPLYDVIFICVYITLVTTALVATSFHNGKLAEENSRLRVASQETEILLKDCPICGSRVEVSTLYNAYTVKCTKCGLSSKVYYDLDKLIDYWNTGTR